MTYRSDELYHYGIKGMKWGVRRYQNKDGTLTPAGRERYRDGDGRKPNNSPESFVNGIRNKAVSSLTNKTGSGEAEIAVLLAAYVVVPAAYLTALVIKAKTFPKKRMALLETMKDDRDFESIKDVPKLSKKMSPEESMSHTNPDYPKKGHTMNCTFCTTAMAMREKGYNVKAKTTDDGWPADMLFDKAFNSKTVKMSPKATASDLIKDLSKQGNGSYGNLTVTWKFGGGHSVFWKVVDGKVHIYDGQAGKEYDVSNPKNSDFLNSILPGYASYNRFDNCNPTEYALSLIEAA